ncbi:GDSL-type esterase/lipase family protein [Kitasatospora sp. NPDC059646]|uniref:GDSL-type esterase/lipase family protein n=1 Tax=Kitasatospora sp. NPDC059646 TaxID=3346893 RepID=UPI00367B9625
MTESRPHTLFCFGTLLDPGVRTAVLGRTVPAEPASLPGCTAVPLAPGGRDPHLVLGRRLGSTVDGAVLRLSEDELAAADAHVAEHNARRRVRLASGEAAWAHLDARPLRAASRVVIVGDSIAYGRCDPRGGWAGRFAAAHIGANETEHRVFNLAVPGSTLADVAQQTPALLTARHPDTLVVAAGINDSAVPLTATDADRDGLREIAGPLASLAATARKHQARLVVLGPLWLDESRTGDFEGLRFTTARALALREALRSWCAEQHLDFLDLWEPLRDRPELFVDGLHPDAEGHREVHRHLSALGC